MKNGNGRVRTLAKLNNRKGLSLMELIVVTVIIAIIACIAFPTFTLIQQRSKEKRLKKILTEVRAAISGTKSHQSANEFQEGFRTIARVKGMELIKAWATANSMSFDLEQLFINAFVTKIAQGNGYPATPEDIWSKNPRATIGVITIGTDFFDFGNPSGEIDLERRFYRNKPIHPFKDWYKTADFAYVPVLDTTGAPEGRAYTLEEWTARATDLKGVKDIVSRNAGIGLDGSSTDEW